jgi:hypothetical protein
MIRADQQSIVNLLTSGYPQIIHCHRGARDDQTPTQMIEVEKQIGGDYAFASINCSQALPSGKNVFDRFKLKRQIRPVVFGVAPWSRPLQASARDLKDAKSFQTFVEKNFAPKVTEIGTDAELRKICQLTKPDISEMSSIRNTCIVLVRGTRYSKTHSDLEEKLLRHHPKAKICAINASKKRLSVEDIDTHPPDSFGLKVYAIRNGDRFLPMVNPVTWDYLNTFVSYVFAQPLTSYSIDDSSKGIKLIKVASTFKDRSQNTNNEYQSKSKPKSRSSKSQTNNGKGQKEEQSKKSAGEHAKSDEQNTDTKKKDDREDYDSNFDSNEGNNDDDNDDDEDIIEL